MKHRFRLAFSFFAISLLSTSAHAAPASQLGRSCHLPGYDQPLRCVTVSVPLDYRQPAGEKLTLHVTVAPAFRESARPDPLFILAGGPGQAGSDILPLIDSTFRKVRATRDIVFIDQRGTGRSGKLDCKHTQLLDELPIPEQEAMVAACMRSLNKPFALYNTDNAARDLEQVRQTLGYGLVNVWGASYGTRLGQAYARRFPDSIRSLILDGVVSPEQIIFAWGRDAQAALDAVFQRCAKDPGCGKTFPSLRTQFNAVMQRVNAGVVKLDYSHPRTATRSQIRLPPTGFLQTMRTALYSTNSSSRVPFLIDSADKGNWGPFLAQMSAVSDLSVNSSAIGLTLSVTCAEDIPRLTPAIVAEEERNSFLAGSEVKVVPAWCRFVNVPAIPYQAPSVIRAPVLLLSGALDPVTPPRRAENAATHMTRAQHFVVANAGHIVSPLGCTPRLLREFLDRPEQPLQAQCLDEIPQTSFQLGSAGPQP